MWLLCAILFLYFLPFFVGLIRRHQHPILLFCFNASLGWTGWGWIIAIAFSLWTFQDLEFYSSTYAGQDGEPSDDDPELLRLMQMRKIRRLRQRKGGVVLEFPLAKAKGSLYR
jgi:hypothetical protein